MYFAREFVEVRAILQADLFSFSFAFSTVQPSPQYAANHPERADTDCRPVQ